MRRGGLGGNCNCCSDSFSARLSTVGIQERRCFCAAARKTLCHGALVVFHDLRLDRLTPLSGPLRARPVAALREVGIPTLAEVVELHRRLGRTRSSVG